METGLFEIQAEQLKEFKRARQAFAGLSSDAGSRS
jgi:hypothetical protein